MNIKNILKLGTLGCAFVLIIINNGQATYIYESAGLNNESVTQKQDRNYYLKMISDDVSSLNKLIDSNLDKFTSAELHSSTKDLSYVKKYINDLLHKLENMYTANDMYQINYTNNSTDVKARTAVQYHVTSVLLSTLYKLCDNTQKISLYTQQIKVISDAIRICELLSDNLIDVLS